MRLPIDYSRLLPGLVLAALSLGFFWKVVFLGQVVYWGTPLLQFFPWRKLAVEMYRSGQVPLWNPYVGFGAPLAANLQSGVFYPLNVFYLFVPVERAMGYTIVLHVALAGLFMYFLARVLGMSILASLIAALSYMFSGYIISRAHFLSMVSAVAWLPLLVACAEGIVVGRHQRAAGLRKGVPWGWVVLLVLGTGMLLLSGHIQLAFYALLALCGYAVFRVVSLLRSDSNREDRWPFAFSALGLLGLSFTTGVALAGIQLVPTAELALHSVRSSGAEYAFALTYSLWPWQLLAAVFPTMLGTPAGEGYWGPGNFWENAMYIGGFPLFLAVAGALGGRGGTRFYFTALGLVAVVFSLGYYTPVYPWVFTHVPGFGLFQAPSRFLFLYTFAAALLCGFGLEYATGAPASGMSKSRLKYFLRLGTAGGVAVMLIAGVVALVGPQQGAMPRESALRIAGSALLFCVACVILLRYDSGWQRLARYGLPALLFSELFLYGTGLNPTTAAELYRAASLDPARYLEEQPGLERVYTSEEVHLSKFFSAFNFKRWGTTDWRELLELRSQLPPDLAAAYHIFEAYNYDPIGLARPARLAKSAEEEGLPEALLMVMNVKYIFTDKRVQDVGSAEVAPHPGRPIPPGLMESKASLPRAFVVPKVRAVASGKEALQELLSHGFDPRREAIVEGSFGDSLEVESRSQGPKVNITKYAASEVVVEVDSGGGLLVLSDSYYPGWRAYVDGEVQEILVANHSFRGIKISPGAHRIVFRYVPESFKLGVLLSSLAVMSLAVMGGLWAKGRMRYVSEPDGGREGV